MARSRASFSKPPDLIATKWFQQSMELLKRQGGQSKRAHEDILAALGAASLDKSEAPLSSLKLTKWGENRIPKCIKYAIQKDYRLVTVHDDHFIALLFAGIKERAEAWLDSNRGLRFVRDKSGSLAITHVSDSLAGEATFTSTPDYSSAPLLSRLREVDRQAFLRVLPGDIALPLSQETAGISDGTIKALALRTDDTAIQCLVSDVLMELRAGDFDAASRRISIFTKDAVPIDDLDDESFLTLPGGDAVRRIAIGSAEHQAWLTAFQNTSEWYDWFLFLHPDQQKAVDTNFDGPAQLSGVSGSGKTCVVVRRAIRLSAAEHSPRVLVLTLNRSLARLIDRLVSHACSSPDMRSRIDVVSLFEFCQRIIRLRVGAAEADRHFVDVTWKNNEHVDEIFREFYRCWNNNDDAATLLPIHRSLTSQGLEAERYIREEFDWVRSGTYPDARDEYLTLSRGGRKIPLLVDRRKIILSGLNAWEDKMKEVGVIDYLGLTQEALKYDMPAELIYDHVLVDESQDFGTVELEIAARAARQGANSIFLTGDISQHILPKHRDLRMAPSLTGPIEKLQLKRNYRNSKEILNLAYEVLTTHIDESQLYDLGDLEILDPEHANFSYSVPSALHADSLTSEIQFALSRAHDSIDRETKTTICIAIAGFTLFEVAQFARAHGYFLLDGSSSSYDPKRDRIVLSDLEQTKGYEFDCVIILNCREGVLPSADVPSDEAFRDACRLYVAMTRARKELFLSYHGQLSSWLDKPEDLLGRYSWGDVEEPNRQYAFSPPAQMGELERSDDAEGLLSLNGLAFGYTSAARGLSIETLERTSSKVKGEGAIRGGTHIEWKTMRDLRSDLLAGGAHDSILGRKVAEELRLRLKDMR